MHSMAKETINLYIISSHRSNFKKWLHVQERPLLLMIRVIFNSWFRPKNKIKTQWNCTLRGLKTFLEQWHVSVLLHVKLSNDRAKSRYCLKEMPMMFPCCFFSWLREVWWTRWKDNGIEFIFKIYFLLIYGV